MADTYPGATTLYLRDVPEYLAKGFLLLDRLREQRPDTDAVWLLPLDVLRGVTHIRGVPVQHVDGLTGPMLALPFPVGREAPGIRGIDLR